MAAHAGEAVIVISITPLSLVLSLVISRIMQVHSAMHIVVGSILCEIFTVPRYKNHKNLDKDSVINTRCGKEQAKRGLGGWTWYESAPTNPSPHGVGSNLGNESPDRERVMTLHLRLSYTDFPLWSPAVIGTRHKRVPRQLPANNWRKSAVSVLWDTL